MSDECFEAFKKEYPWPAQLIEKRQKTNNKYDWETVELAQLPRAEEAWDAFQKGWNAAKASSLYHTNDRGQRVRRLIEEGRNHENESMYG